MEVDPIIKNYLKDTSIPLEKRTFVLGELKKGAAQNKLSEAISNKYGDKYGSLGSPLDSVTSQAPVAERKGWLSKAANIGIGVAQGAAETIKNTAGAGSELFQKAGSALGGGLAGLLPGQEGFKAGAQEALQKIEKEGSAVDQLIPDEALEAKNKYQKIGKGAERIAEFIVPGTAALKGAKALRATKALAATETGSVLKEGVKTLGRALTTPAAEAVAAGATTAAQEGSMENVARNAAIGAAVPVVAKPIGKLAGKAFSKAKQLTTEAGRLERRAEKVQKLVQPEMSKKEIKAAIEEGRMVRGEKGLLGKAEDKIELAQKVKEAAGTVARNIKGIDKMDDAKLYVALKGKVGELSKNLKPELQKIRLKKEMLDEAEASWEAIKRTQSEDPVLQSFAGLKTSQRNFDNILKSFKTSVKDPDGKFRTKSLDDLWDKAKAYDQTVREAIKDSPTSEASQLYKKIWLQNRGILRDLLKRESERLGVDSGRTFKEMMDYFTIQGEIAKLAKKEKGFPSWLKNVLVTAGTGAAAGVVGAPIVNAMQSR